MGTPGPGSIRVLLADDHSIVREGVRSILDGAPEIVVVGEAGDGMEAIAAAAKLKPDVVVLDIQMPRGGGLETLRVLRRDHPRIAVLILSFHAEEVFALPFLREGAHGYLTKDDAIESLVEAVRRVHCGGRYVTGSAAEGIARGLDRTATLPPHQRLSAQELVILSLMASGRTVEEIAGELLLSPRTIHRCCSRILLKTGLPSTAAAIQYAIESDIRCPARSPSADSSARGGSLAALAASRRPVGAAL
jgi:DNA-binding NarL/FixJ family response regulator